MQDPHDSEGRLAQAGTDSVERLTPERRALLALLLKKKSGDTFSSPTPKPSARANGARKSHPLQDPIAPVSRDQDLPLSFSQQRLWFLSQLEPDGYGYNLPGAFRLTGELHVGVLERCLTEIVRRHEALRTTFVLKAGRPVQVVGEADAFTIPLVDLTRLPAGLREQEVQAQCAEEFQRPFDLVRGPLIRARLLRLAEREYVMSLTLHHIVSDGWSSTLLIRELGLLYEAFLAGRPSPLAELPVQYADYACWQHRHLEGDVLGQQLDYWKEQLAGPLPDLDWQAARPRPARLSYNGARRSCVFPLELAQRLHQLSRQEGATLFMTLLAAYKILLNRYSGQTDIIVGAPIANRRRKEVEPLIGCFVNTLALRTDLSGDPSFRQLLSRVRETALAAFTHQDIPFEKLVESLQPRRRLNRNPIFQVMFILQNNPVLNMDLPGPRITPILPEATATDFDLNLAIIEHEHGLSASLEYNLDLFDADAIDRMFGHLRTLLESAVHGADLPVSQLQMLTAAERQQLGDWNGERCEHQPACVHQLVERQAEREPTATALVCGRERLSYGELNERANQLAHHLAQLGVGPESRVGVCVGRSIEMVIGLLAILKAGGAYVPLDPVYPPERLGWILSDAGIETLVTTSAQAGVINEACANQVLLDSHAQRIAERPRHNPSNAVTPANLAYVIYTSGSTGRPKGVLVSHQNVAHLLQSLDARFGLRAGEVWTVFHSFAFDFSVWEIWAPLACGSRLVVVPTEAAQSPEMMFTLLADERVTVMNQTPSAFRQLLDFIAAAPARAERLALRRIVLGGEALPREVVRDGHLGGVELWNFYGPTEATVWAACLEITDKERPITIGSAIANAQLHVLDERLNPVPVGFAGDLYIGGYGIARGYWNRPDLSAERFIPDPFASEPGARMYRTGDVARYDHDGHVEFIGRSDHQVKVKGFRIELGEIEATLAEHGRVREAVVLARKTASGDRRLVAYVVAAGEPPPAVSQLHDFLKQRLPDYMIPAAFVMLDRLPISPNGKLDRNALPEPGGARPALRTAYKEAHSETERALAEIWAALLGLDRVGVEDNFFELGGDSILAIQVVARAAEAGVSLYPGQLFLHPTIGELARHAGSVTVRPADEPTQNQEQANAATVRSIDANDDSIEAAYGVSPMQEGMLFHSLFAPDAGEYLEQVCCTIDEALNVEAFERAWQMVVDSNAALRTAFVWQGRDEMRQVVKKHVEFRIRQHDLRGLTADEQAARVASHIEAEQAGGAFDLAVAPLTRVTLFQLEEARYQFVWSYHHLLIDGWSLPLVIEELHGYYAASAKGERPEAVTRRPYRDYVEWLRRRDLTEAETYWRKQLRGFDSPTRLAGGESSAISHAQASTYDDCELRLSVAATAGLQTLARHRLTLNTVLQGAWAILLSRYSGQDDVVFGGVVAGRAPELQGVESMVGLCINTLPVRVKVATAAPLADFLQAIQHRQAEARRYEHSPLVKVQRWSDLPRGQSLFESVLVLDAYPNAAALRQTGAWSCRSHSLQRTGYPVHLQVIPGDELTLRLTVANRLIDRGAIRRLLEQYKTLLENIPAHLDGPTAELPMLSQSEERQLLIEWRGATAAFPLDSCMQQLFEAQTERTPNRLAARCGAQDLSYGGLNANANRLARTLIEHGTDRDETVAILAQRGLDYLTAMLAVFKAGGAYIPLDPRHPAARHRQIVQESGCRLILATAEFESDLAQALSSLPDDKQPRIIALGEETHRAQSADNLPLRSTPQSLAYVIYTSGSTGVPKGAMVEHAGMLNHLFAKIRDLGLTENDVIAQTASQCFDISVWQFLVALLVGGHVEIFEDDIAFDHTRLVAEVARRHVTILETVPSLMRAMLKDESNRAGHGLAELRWMIPTGEALPPDVCHEWFAQYPAIPLLNAYGPTECSDDVTHYRLDRPPREKEVRISIGRPVANLRIHILDSLLRPVPVGVVGEICVGGIGVGRGYLSRPELTADRFIPDPFGARGMRLYRTGDLGRYETNGEISYLGRADHQVKVRGYRIELGEIEAALLAVEGVRQAVVVAREDEGGEKRLVAYVVREAGVERERIREAVREELPEWMVPGVIVELEQMPLSANGKIDRKALPAPEAINGESGRDYAAPVTPTEQIVAGIWGDVLGRDQVGIDDNFFELDGHSLLATQMVSRIREAFNVEVPLRGIFERPTVRGFAEMVDAAVQSRRGLQASPVAKAEDRRAPALSFGQRRLWFLDQMEPGGSFYNIPSAVRLTGDLDVAVLAGALGEVIRRHEVLRTTFDERDGQPVAVIHEHTRLRLPVVDLCLIERAAREREAERLATAEAQLPFDLVRGPLIRATLLALDPRTHVALLTMHHIISDGWSAGVLVKEVATLYEAFQAGRPSPLAALPIQYADFAAWQRTLLEDEGLAPQLSYWQQQLGGELPTLDLPTDFARPPVQTHRGASETLTIDRELAGAIKALSRREGATVFIVLLAALKLLLHRYAQQTDIIVGTPIAGRTRKETEALIGFFVNTLALRTDLGGEPTFRELIARVRETALGAYAHQDVPFEKLVEVLQPERSLSRSPIFQVMLNMLNLKQEAVELPGLTVEAAPFEVSTTKFDLTLYAVEADAEIALMASYNADLFTRERMAEQLAHLRELLAQVTADPARPIGEYSLVTASAARLLPDPRRPLERAFAMTVHDRISHEARRAGYRIAVIDEEEELSYSELESHSNRLARSLIEIGISRGDVVAIYAARNTALIVAMLGVLKAGAAILVLDPRYPVKRLSRFVRLAQAQALIEVEGAEGAAALLDDLSQSDSRPPWLKVGRAGRYKVGQSSDAPVSIQVGADDTAYVVFTSGTTGEPKAIATAHAPLSHFIEWACDRFALDARDRFGVMAGLSHDPLMRDVFTGLYCGGTVCIPHPRTLEDGAALVEWMGRRQVSVIHLTPPLGLLMTEARATRQRVLATLRYAFFGGDVLTASHVRRMNEVAPVAECVNYYGTSETPQGVAYSVISQPGSDAAFDPRPRSLPIGKGIRDVQLLILNGDRLAGIGEAGEICVRTPYLSKGYIGRERETIERFVTNPLTGETGDTVYRTGDLGRYETSGEISYLGRADHQVKVRGYRIELGEIEAALLGVEGVRQAVVVAREDERDGEKRLVAYVVREAGLERERIREAVREELPEWMVPGVIVELEQMPLSANGKIDRKALPAFDAKDAQRRSVYVAPRNENEAAIAAIWEELLSVERVGATDHFFDLGGHSLLATQIMSRVRERFGIELSLRKMFERPTVEGLAEAVEEAKQKTNASRPAVIVAAERGGRRMKRTAAGGLAPAPTPQTLPPPAPAQTTAPAAITVQEPSVPYGRHRQAIDFSLFFFSDDGSTTDTDKYGLLKESVRFADRQGFRAVWTPERHFHDFGGLYPNPAVTGAALAMITERLQIRAGSVVLPLQDPLRVAEEWAAVDNLSGGRVAIAFASGWHVNDFALNPGAYDRRREVMYERISLIERLWQGEAIKRANGAGNEVEVSVFPRPIQPRLPIWITAQSDESFIKAGHLGANVLTNFNYKREEELAERIEKYRAARRQSGTHGGGTVTLMMHTFVWNDPRELRERVRHAYGEYLTTNLGLQAKLAAGLNIEANVSEADMQVLIENAIDRLMTSHGMVGSVEDCVARARRLAEMGVDEIACLIDFGVDRATVLESLVYLDQVKSAVAEPASQTELALSI